MWCAIYTYQQATAHPEPCGQENNWHGRCEHITPVLKSLHWLPVQQRIKFKTLVLVHKAVNNMVPVYLQQLLHPHVTCRGLRSSENNLLVFPFTTSSVIQQCAFGAAGRRLWNSPPVSLRSASRFLFLNLSLKLTCSKSTMAS